MLGFSAMLLKFYVASVPCFPNQDGESGWSSLHRAMHFGHLAVACILIQSGASLALEDSKSRTPIDLLSGPVVQAVQSVQDAGNWKLLCLLLKRGFCSGDKKP